MTIQTIILNNGRTVLAKTGKYGCGAVMYANRAQAQRKEKMLRAAGIQASVIHPGRAFYLEIH